MPSIIIVSSFLTIALLDFSQVLNAKIGKVWVKALDFPYLILASIGLFRVLNALPSVTQRNEDLNVIGIYLLALAISIRLTKATIEVFFDNWYNY